MEARGEKLLQSLVDEEKALMAKVEEAKSEAAKILEDARAEAAKAIEAARDKMKAMSAEQLKVTEAESDAIRKEILGEAKSAIAAVKNAASANAAKAAKEVMERLVP